MRSFHCDSPLTRSAVSQDALVIAEIPDDVVFCSMAPFPQDHRQHQLLCSLPEHGEPARRRLPELLPVGSGGIAGLHCVVAAVSLVFKTADPLLQPLPRRIVHSFRTAHTCE